MTCLITGCALNDLAHSRTVHGDLHCLTGVYIFNAVLDHGEAAWQEDTLAGDHALALTWTGPEGFERRGVIVIPMTSAHLNPRAQSYVTREDL